MAAPAHPLRRLLRYASRHRGRIRLAVASSITNKLFDLAPPALIGAAVDIIVRREASILAELGVVDVRDQIWVLALVTLLIWAFESLFEYLQKWLWRTTAQRIQHELRVDAYRHAQALDMAYHETRRTGGLMAILNDDVNQLERFLDIGADDLLQVTTTVLVIGATFFLLAPDVAWLAMLPMPFVLWGSVAFQARIAPRYEAVRERVALLNGQLSTNLTGLATVKSYAAEEHEVDRIRTLSDDYRVANRGAIRLSSAFSPLIRMVIVVGFTATLILGGFAALEGRIEVGTYSVLVFLTQRLLWPLTRLGQTFDLYQRAMASTRRVLDLLDAPIHVQSGAQALPRDAVRGDVRFDHVGFAYPGRDALFTDLDITVKPGQTVAFVGSTGAGKSTVVKLLLRFYDPDSGVITIDGVPTPELDLADLRRAIGFVDQDVFLFHGTVAENIAYGQAGAGAPTMEAIRAAAAVAEVDEFVSALPRGYDTIVGERGQRLSGGQRQRIAIARAVLKDPPILVFDEATSAVDNETEAAIQRSIERITRDRTTFIIAHRLSTVRHADRIFVLAGGRVAEAGRHEELLAAGGQYAGLWRVQTGERAADAA